MIVPNGLGDDFKKIFVDSRLEMMLFPLKSYMRNFSTTILFSNKISTPLRVLSSQPMLMSAWDMVEKVTTLVVNDVPTMVEINLNQVLNLIIT